MTTAYVVQAERLLVQTGFGRVRLARLRRDNQGREHLIDLESHPLGGTGPAIGTVRAGIGAVLLGRAVRCDRSLDAAFVDIGQARPALLRATDCRHFDPPGLPDEGAVVLVQIDRAAEPDAEKGARVTSRIRLAGQTVVLAPFEPGLAGIDASPDLAAATTALKALLRDLPSAGSGRRAGAILRAATRGLLVTNSSRAVSLVHGELTGLLTAWQAIDTARRLAKPPRLLHAAPDWIETAIGVLIVGQTVIVDARLGRDGDRPAAARLVTAVRQRVPSLQDRLVWHRTSEPLFSAENVDAAIASVLAPTVWLPSGGRLTIEPTAALTAIDVDSAAAGRALGGNATRDALALRVNLEAAAEIARQLRLRRIGGLVAVDFLDLTHEPDRRQVMDRLRAAFADDPAPVWIDDTRTMGRTGMGSSGLVVLTRRRRGLTLAEDFGTVCASCDGSGRRPDPEVAAMAALDGLATAIRTDATTPLALAVAPDVAAALETGPAGAARADCTAALGAPIRLTRDTSMPPGSWRVGA